MSAQTTDVTHAPALESALDAPLRVEPVRNGTEAVPDSLLPATRNTSRELADFTRHVALVHAVTVPAPETGVTARDLIFTSSALRNRTMTSGFDGVLCAVGAMAAGMVSVLSLVTGDVGTAAASATGAAALSGLMPAMNVARRRKRGLSFLATFPLDRVVEVTQPSERLLDLITDNDSSPAGRQAVWDEAQRCLVAAQNKHTSLREDTDQMWADANSRFERVASEWEELLLDPLAALEHSVLLDVTKPRTAAFLTAYGKAKDAHDRHTSLPAGTSPGITAVEGFADLVRTAETSWDQAKQWAAHVGYDWLPEAERADAILADKLLRLAADETASPAERVSAAERATAVLRRIHTVVLPEPALEVLARRSRGELTSSSSTDTGSPILTPTPTPYLAETR